MNEAPIINVSKVCMPALHYEAYRSIRWLGFDGGARRGKLITQPAMYKPGIAYDIDRREFQNVLPGEYKEYGAADDDGNPK